MSKKVEVEKKKNEPLASSPCFFFLALSIELRVEQVPTFVFLCLDASMECRYAPLTAHIDQRQRNKGALGALFFGQWRRLSFDRWMFLFFSSCSLKTNALEEAIATTLDLKCCLEAGALRAEERGERGTEEESLRAKVDSINTGRRATKKEKKRRKSELGKRRGRARERKEERN